MWDSSLYGREDVARVRLRPGAAVLGAFGPSEDPFLWGANFVLGQCLFHRQVGRKLKRSQFPEIVGLAEVAAMLDTSPRQALRWSRASDFPEPVAELQAGRVWLKAEVAKWARKRRK